MTTSVRKLFGLLCLFSSIGAGHAADLTVTGTGATGSPGGHVVLELVVDYGSSFNAMLEQFKVQYDPDVLDFVTAKSSVETGGSSKSWTSHLNQLLGVAFAQNGSGGNTESDPLAPEGQYAFNFYTSGPPLPGDVRSETVRYRLWFDVLPRDASTQTQVTFSDSMVMNPAEDEFYYPQVLASPGLTVNVIAVPEPSQAILLLAGAGLLAVWRLRARS